MEKAKRVYNDFKLISSSAENNIKNVTVSDFMTREVKTITENETLKQACKLMYQDNIGSIVILKKIPWIIMMKNIYQHGKQK